MPKDEAQLYAADELYVFSTNNLDYSFTSLSWAEALID